MTSIKDRVLALQQKAQATRTSTSASQPQTFQSSNTGQTFTRTAQNTQSGNQGQGSIGPGMSALSESARNGESNRRAAFQTDAQRQAGADARNGIASSQQATTATTTGQYDGTRTGTQKIVAGQATTNKAATEAYNKARQAYIDQGRSTIVLDAERQNQLDEVTRQLGSVSKVQSFLEKNRAVHSAVAKHASDHNGKAGGTLQSFLKAEGVTLADHALITRLQNRTGTKDYQQANAAYADSILPDELKSFSFGKQSVHTTHMNDFRVRADELAKQRDSIYGEDLTALGTAYDESPAGKAAKQAIATEAVLNFQTSGKNAYDWIQEQGNIEDWNRVNAENGVSQTYDYTQREWEDVIKQSNWYKNNSPEAKAIAREKAKWGSAIDSEVKRRSSELEGIQNPELKAKLLKQIRKDVSNGSLAAQRDESLYNMNLQREASLEADAVNIRNDFKEINDIKEKSFSSQNSDLVAEAENKFLLQKRQESIERGVPFNAAYYSNMFKSLSKYEAPKDKTTAEGLYEGIEAGIIDPLSPTFADSVYKQFNGNMKKAAAFVSEYQSKPEVEAWQEGKYKEQGMSVEGAKRETTINGVMEAYTQLNNDELPYEERVALTEFITQQQNNEPREWFLGTSMAEYQETFPESTPSELFEARLSFERVYDAQRSPEKVVKPKVAKQGTTLDRTDRAILAELGKTQAAFKANGEDLTIDQVKDRIINTDEDNFTSVFTRAQIIAAIEKDDKIIAEQGE